MLFVVGTFCCEGRGTVVGFVLIGPVPFFGGNLFTAFDRFSQRFAGHPPHALEIELVFFAPLVINFAALAHMDPHAISIFLSYFKICLFYRIEMILNLIIIDKVYFYRMTVFLTSLKR